MGQGASRLGNKSCSCNLLVELVSYIIPGKLKVNTNASRPPSNRNVITVYNMVVVVVRLMV